jgi:hypothetical protein
MIPVELMRRSSGDPMRSSAVSIEFNLEFTISVAADGLLVTFRLCDFESLTEAEIFTIGEGLKELISPSKNSISPSPSLILLRP